MMWFFDFLFPPRVDETALRGVSSDEFLALVAPNVVSTTRPHTVALLPFHDSRVRATIHEAKYHGNGRAVELLALALAEYLRDSDDIKRTKANIVPVPLGKKRLKERGFNQVEEVVKRAATQCGGAMIDVAILERTRETVSQISLPRRAREENMRGAFGAAHPADPSRIYVVVDDVTTTGATLQAAITALREAGAEHIIPLALAH